MTARQVVYIVRRNDGFGESCLEPEPSEGGCYLDEAAVVARCKALNEQLAADWQAEDDRLAASRQAEAGRAQAEHDALVAAGLRTPKVIEVAGYWHPPEKGFYDYEPYEVGP